MSEKDIVLSLQDNEEIEATPSPFTITITTVTTLWSTVSNDCDTLH